MSAPVSKAGQGHRLPLPMALGQLHKLQQRPGTAQAQMHQPGFAPSRMLGWWMLTPCSTPCPLPWLIQMWTHKAVRETTDYSNNPDGDQVGKAGTR